MLVPLADQEEGTREERSLNDTQNESREQDVDETETSLGWLKINLESHTCSQSLRLSQYVVVN